MALHVSKDFNPTVVAVQHTLASSLHQIHEIRSEPLQQKKAWLRTEYGIKENSNPMLTIPVKFFFLIYPACAA